MIIGRKYYKIQMFFENSGTENSFIGNSNINNFLEKVEIDSFKPIDLYNFSGEPRKAKIVLNFGVNKNTFCDYRKIFLADGAQTINPGLNPIMHDVSPTDNGNILKKLISFPGLTGFYSFPGWRYETEGITYPPVLNEGDEIEGAYLDYDDIYIKKDSKFFNLYVKVYEVSNESESISESNRVYTGMVERETVKILKSKNKIEFELQDGLAIFYDALEKYENFTTACQDETYLGNGLYEPNEYTGITMKKFIDKIAQKLTKYPYATLFNFIPPPVAETNEHPLFTKTFIDEYRYNLMIETLGIDTSNPNYSRQFYRTRCYFCYQESRIVVVNLHIAMIAEDFVGYLFTGVALPIFIDTENNIFIETNQSNIIDYYIRAGNGDYPSEAFNQLFSSPQELSNLFPEYQYIYNGHSDMVDIDETQTEINILGKTLYAKALRDELIITTTFQQKMLPSDYSIFELCTSFTENVSPLFMIRMTCLTKAMYFFADGYDLKFRRIDAAFQDIKAHYQIDYNKIIKGSIEETFEINEKYNFEEIEKITFWKVEPGEDITQEDLEKSKNLKTRIKGKYSFLKQIDRRIEFDIPKSELLGYNEIEWSDTFEIINDEDYIGNVFFIYEIDKSDNKIINIKAFKLNMKT